MQVLIRLIDMLGQPANITYVFGAYLGVCAVAVVLRIIVCVGYQTHFGIFRINAKPINSRVELDKARIGLLRNIIPDYIRIAEKNTSAVHLTAIIRKHMLRLSFLGWSYDSMERFILGIEPMLPIMGFALAIIFYKYENSSIIFGVTAVCVFALIRLFAGLFDFQLVSAKLAAELEEYVEREAGQFYAGDFGTVLLRFKNEVSNALKSQADALSGVIVNLEKNLSGALNLTMKELSNEMSGIGAVLDKPLKDWAASISAAADAQARNNEVFKGFEGAAAQLKVSAGELDGVLRAHVNAISTELAMLSGHVDTLALTGKGLKESGDAYKQSVDILDAQIKYIEKNQGMLRDALGSYESSLQSITQKMGDGFGSIVEYHIAGAYQTLNTALQNNINKITAANQELTSRLSSLFEELMEQSRNETGAIVNMNDQMNLRFEAIENKLA